MKDKGALFGLVIGLIVAGLVLGFGYKIVRDLNDGGSIKGLLEGSDVSDDNIDTGKSETANSNKVEDNYKSVMTLLPEDALVYVEPMDDDFIDERLDTNGDWVVMDGESSAELIEEAEPIVSGFSPTSGSTGQIVEIKGLNLMSKNIVDVTFGQQSVPIFNIQDDLIQCTVNSDLEPGSQYEVNVNYEDDYVLAGIFEVLALDGERLIEEEIMDTTVWNNFMTEHMNVYIPPNAVDGPSVLTVDKLDPIVGDNFHQSIQDGDYYDIRIGDQHEFDGIISIELPVPEWYDLAGNVPLVTYLDEDRGTWEPMISEITDKGTLAIRTDHLTTVSVYWMYESILSSDGFFRIYYDEDDKKVSGPGFTTSKELAELIAVSVENARKIYDKELGEAYKLQKPTTLGISSTYPVVVHSGYSRDGGYYTPVVKVTHLPGNYETAEDLNTTPAHELFHLYQNQVIDYKRMSKNLWLIEATADYASYRLVNHVNPRIRPSTKSVPQSRLVMTNDSHEYSCSAFLDYAFIKTGVKFNELWEAFVKDSNTDYQDKLVYNVFDDKIKGTSTPSIELFYRAFWLESMVDNSPDWSVDPSFALSRTFGVRSVARNFVASHNPSDGSTQKFISYSALGMNDNVPVRYLKVTSKDGNYANIRNVILKGNLTFQKGIKLSNAVGKQIKDNMKDGQVTWDWVMSANGDKTYSILELSMSDTALFAIQPVGVKGSIRLREVNTTVETKSFEDIKIGEEVIVRYGFKDIFEETTSVIVETDFGDKTILTETFDSTTTVNIEAKHMYKNAGTDKITASLYDFTGGKKELIGQIVIPITFDQEVILTADNYSPKIGDKVTFTVNVGQKGYQYEWDFDDGDLTTNNSNTMTFTYVEEGFFTAVVNVTDASGKAIGAGLCDIEVQGIEENAGEMKEGWNLVEIRELTSDDIWDEVVFSENSVTADSTTVSHTRLPDHFDKKAKVSTIISVSTANEKADSIGVSVHYRLTGDEIYYSFDGAEDGLVWVSGKGSMGLPKSNTGELYDKIPGGKSGDTLEIDVGIWGAMHKYVYVWYEE